MLAQNFLSAKQLDITEHQHAALVGILGMLERGEFVQVDYEDSDFVLPAGKLAFDMEYWHEVAHRCELFRTKFRRCGTVGCIGGWADALFRTKFRFQTSSSTHRLFHPPSTLNWAAITPEKAAMAVRNFLGTGKPDWEGVLAA